MAGLGKVEQNFDVIARSLSSGHEAMLIEALNHIGLEGLRESELFKLARIRRMVPIFEAGRFLLPESLIKVDYEGKHIDLVRAFLLEEYSAFPVGLHDDMFDAISRICDEDLGAVWPKLVLIEDRYARSRHRSKRGTWMAA
jgi:phage terminase large subunit-like protein